jgi:hypothetical protein
MNFRFIDAQSPSVWMGLLQMLPKKSPVAEQGQAVVGRPVPRPALARLRTGQLIFGEPQREFHVLNFEHQALVRIQFLKQLNLQRFEHIHALIPVGSRPSGRCTQRVTPSLYGTARRPCGLVACTPDGALVPGAHFYHCGSGSVGSAGGSVCYHSNSCVRISHAG